MVTADEALSAALLDLLAGQGWRVTHVRTGTEMLSLERLREFHIAVFDIDRNGSTGWHLARQFRQQSNAGLVLLSKLHSQSARIYGYKMGSDAFLLKPFNPNELVIRIRNLHFRIITGKRTSVHKYTCWQFDGWILDVSEQILYSPDGEAIPLTRQISYLLQYLCKNPHNVISREALLGAISDKEREATDRTPDVLICQLRKILKRRKGGYDYIETHRGDGYKFTVIPYIIIS